MLANALIKISLSSPSMVHFPNTLSIPVFFCLCPIVFSHFPLDLGRFTVIVSVLCRFEGPGERCSRLVPLGEPDAAMSPRDGSVTEDPD